MKNILKAHIAILGEVLANNGSLNLKLADLKRSVDAFCVPELLISRSMLDNKLEIYYNRANSVTKPKPVMVSADGVSINVDDIFAVAFFDDNNLQWIYFGKHTFMELGPDRFKDRPDLYKAFSTEQAAKLWIDEWTAQHQMIARSEDGVPLYPGDRCYTVHKPFDKWSLFSAVCRADKSLYGVIHPKDFKLFSTKDAAERWILKENSPVKRTKIYLKGAQGECTVRSNGNIDIVVDGKRVYFSSDDLNDIFLAQYKLTSGSDYSGSIIVEACNPGK